MNLKKKRKSKMRDQCQPWLFCKKRGKEELGHMILITQLGEKSHNHLHLQAATGSVWQPHKRL